MYNNKSYYYITSPFASVAFSPHLSGSLLFFCVEVVKGESLSHIDNWNIKAGFIPH